MIWHNLAKSGPNMGVGEVHDLLKSLVMGPSLLGNCYLENKIHPLKKSKAGRSPL